MRWPQDARDWPLTDYSRLVVSRPHRWHVQQTGVGPSILLIHGAGGATHSWRDVMPILARQFHVIAVDLPGQGFTQMGGRQRCNLRHMAEDLSHLVRAENWQLTALIGHSAGAAIALEMAATPPFSTMPIVGINPALGNFKGVAGWLFPFMAKVLAMNPLTARIFAATSSAPGRVARLVEGTGSHLDAQGLALYQRLASDRVHVDATLAMMSQWSLDALLRRLGQINNPTLFFAADLDKAVPPETATLAASQMPNARVLSLPGLGHLAHEEAPELVADQILEFLGVVRG